MCLVCIHPEKKKKKKRFSIFSSFPPFFCSFRFLIERAGAPHFYLMHERACWWISLIIIFHLNILVYRLLFSITQPHRWIIFPPLARHHGIPVFSFIFSRRIGDSQARQQLRIIAIYTHTATDTDELTSQ